MVKKQFLKKGSVRGSGTLEMHANILHEEWMNNFIESPWMLGCSYNNIWGINKINLLMQTKMLVFEIRDKIGKNVKIVKYNDVSLCILVWLSVEIFGQQFNSLV